jgi:hypothetical protein
MEHLCRRDYPKRGAGQRELEATGLRSEESQYSQKNF